MTEVTVTCGCGRKMRSDTLRGRGAFICGCGIRVHVDVPPPAPQCIGLIQQDGTSCPKLPIRESAEIGLPLCADHHGIYQEALKIEGHRQQANSLFDWYHRWEYDEPAPPEPYSDEELAQKRRDRSVIYYIRIAGAVKIGTTVNMVHRMNDLRPDEILATEPGGPSLETKRHKQFAHLRTGRYGERFRPEPDLMSHIAMIRDHFGEPVTNTRGLHGDVLAYPDQEPDKAT